MTPELKDLLDEIRDPKDFRLHLSTADRRRLAEYIDELEGPPTDNPVIATWASLEARLSACERALNLDKLKTSDGES